MDKSLFIKDALSYTGKPIVMYCVPHGFGKTVNLSMLDCFLNVEYQGTGLFEDLEISKNKNLYEMRNAFPVVYLDLQRLYGKNVDELKTNLAKTIEVAASEFPFGLQRKPNDTDGTALLVRLISSLSADFGKGTVVIVDGWDAAFRNRTRRYHGKMEIMHRFMDSVATAPGLYKAVFTSVIIPESDVNSKNVDIVYGLFRPDPMFGFSDIDVRKLIISDCVFDYVVKWYGGYGYGNYPILSPLCITSFCISGYKPGIYRDISADQPFLEKMARDLYTLNPMRYLRLLSDGKSEYEFRWQKLDVTCCDNTLNLLIQTGILSYDGKYVLIPNIQSKMAICNFLSKRNPIDHESMTELIRNLKHPSDKTAECLKNILSTVKSTACLNLFLIDLVANNQCSVSVRNIRCTYAYTVTVNKCIDLIIIDATGIMFDENALSNVISDITDELPGEKKVLIGAVFDTGIGCIMHGP